MNLSNTAFRLHPTEPYFMCSGDGLDCFLSLGQKATVLFHLPWYATPSFCTRLRRSVAELRKKSITVVILTNQISDLWLARLFRLPAYNINHNLHVPESVYHYLPNQAVVYDAIYIAQAAKFKRIYLAAQVPRLYVLTYGKMCHTASGLYDLHQFEPRVKHCDFNRNFVRDQAEINRLLSISACGLALSSREGAMFGSMEYLMAGLPVVTTRNLGGRDFYLREGITKWVKANPKAVNEAVQFFLEHPVNRKAIRERVLKKVRSERRRFLDLTNALLLRAGKEPTSYDYIWGGTKGIFEHEFRIVPQNC